MAADLYLRIHTIRAANEEFLRRLQVRDPARHVGSGAREGRIRGRIEEHDASVVPSGYTIALDVFKLLSAP